MSVNVEKLRKAIEWAESEAIKAENGEISEWEQGEWIVTSRVRYNEKLMEYVSCGTACCIAGKVALDAGFKSDPNGFRGTLDGDETDVQSVAIRELGLQSYSDPALFASNSIAQRLFDGSNTIYDLWRLANEISNGEIEIPIHRQGFPEEK